MSHRFYLDYSVSSRENDMIRLSGDEAHHFRNVKRGSIGDSLVLFDGSGLSFHGIVEMIQKDHVQIRIIETCTDHVESRLRLTVASALPKGDRQRFLIEKLAELGVCRFVPMQMERSVARANDAVIQRFRRYVIEAAKQCGRNVLMEITDEVPLDKLNDLLTTNDSSGKTANEKIGNEKIAKYILHPATLGSVGQISPHQIFTALPNDPLPENIAILAGPEGSFTDGEVEESLRQGFQPLDLGKRILRTETACIAAAAVFLACEP